MTPVYTEEYSRQFNEIENFEAKLKKNKALN